MKNPNEEIGRSQKLTVEWVTPQPRGPKLIEFEGEVAAEISSFSPASGCPD